MDVQQLIKSKFASTLRKIQANVDRSAFVIFFLLLILMIGIYGYERSATIPEFTTPTGKKIEAMLPNEEYNKCIEYSKTDENLDNDENLRPIRDFNIFNYKYVRDRNELEKAADNKFKRAVKLFDDGKNDEAVKLLNEILLTWPSHIRSQDLFKKIEELRATPTPTPTKTVRRDASFPGM
jgi:hypothetical protein